MSLWLKKLLALGIALIAMVLHISETDGSASTLLYEIIKGLIIMKAFVVFLNYTQKLMDREAVTWGLEEQRQAVLDAISERPSRLPIYRRFDQKRIAENIEHQLMIAGQARVYSPEDRQLILSQRNNEGRTCVDLLVESSNEVGLKSVKDYFYKPLLNELNDNLPKSFAADVIKLIADYHSLDSFTTTPNSINWAYETAKSIMRERDEKALTNPSRSKKKS